MAVDGITELETICRMTSMQYITTPNCPTKGPMHSPCLKRKEKKDDAARPSQIKTPAVSARESCTDGQGGNHF
jgi:hypothetical protein